MMEIFCEKSEVQPSPTPWKNKKTLRFSDVFRGLKKEALGVNGLIINLMVIGSLNGLIGYIFENPYRISIKSCSEFSYESQY